MGQNELHPEEQSEEPSGQTFDPKIEAFVCTYCTYTAADMAGSQRLQYPSTVRIVKYLCTGKVEIIHILKAFEAGADAVFVGG
jgi:F420-non-reducing hydrogenase iron-sulfur subunit